MSKIGLKEITELVDRLDVSELSENDEVQQYFIEMDEVGGEILRSIPKEQFLSAVTLLQALVVVDLLGSGELEMAMLCIKGKGAFGGMMAIALKMSVGIAALEEWR